MNPKSEIIAKPYKVRAKKAKQIVVTFQQGENNKLTVLKVYTDLQEFAELIVSDPNNIPLFAKIDL
jgi:hypothetical protein